MIISEPLRSFSIRMPQDWQIVSFESLMTSPVRNGIYKSKGFHGRGLRIINMGELFAYDFISNQEMKRVELTQNEETKFCVEHGDLLFARRSLVLEGSGKCSIVINPSEKTTFESSIIRVRPNHEVIVPLFLFYLLKSPLGRAIVASIATRTAVSGIRGSDLSQIGLPIPPLPTQHKISAILSAYDDLIENNTKRIKILEEMAQAIYNEWFVKFRFPGHENVKMVDSELGMIPEGWRWAKLKDACDSVNYGYTASASKEPVGPKFLRITDIVPSIIEWENVPHCEIDSKDVDKYTLSEGDIVIARTGATTGYAKRLNKRHPMSVFASYLVRIRPSAVLGKYYVGIIVESEEYKVFIKQNLGGAAQPQANAQVLTSIDILIPTSDVIHAFDEVLQPMVDEKELLQIKNINLRTTRDLLLPRLISGEIDVSELDINAGEVTA